MTLTKIKKEKRDRRHKRIRARISGTKEWPRLSVFKSSRYISAQLIDDENGVTLAAAHSKDGTGKTPLIRAKEVGNKIAQQAKEKNISKAFKNKNNHYYNTIKFIRWLY